MLYLRKPGLRKVLSNSPKTVVNKGQSRIEAKVSGSMIACPDFHAISTLFYFFFLENTFWLLKCLKVYFLKRNVIGHTLSSSLQPREQGDGVGPHRPILHAVTGGTSLGSQSD